MHVIARMGPAEELGALSAMEVAAARARFAFDTDPYGHYARSRESSVDQLIEQFNRGIGKSGWATARGWALAVLRDALLATGLDFSSFIFDDGMNLDRPIER